MELTVLTKKRYDQLVSDIKNLETQIAMANSQLRAIQDSNNQLAEIAFDENRFTDQLLSRVDDLARESAKDSIDVDDIAREVVDIMDISEDVERCVSRMDLVSEDKVNDMVQDFVNDNSLMSAGEVDDAIEEYIESNCDFIERGDVEGVVRDAIAELKEEIIDAVIQAITNKLTAKENDHANNDRDTSLHLSGTIGEGEARSYNAAGA